jgi:hypothetical protein
MNGRPKRSVAVLWRFCYRHPPTTTIAMLCFEREKAALAEYWKWNASLKGWWACGHISMVFFFSQGRSVIRKKVQACSGQSTRAPEFRHKRFWCLVKDILTVDKFDHCIEVRSNSAAAAGKRLRRRVITGKWRRWPPSRNVWGRAVRRIRWQAAETLP